MVRTKTVSDHLRSPNFHSWSMKTCMANAFTVGHLQQIQEFHLWQLSLNASKYPCSSLQLLQEPAGWSSSLTSLSHAGKFKALACMKLSSFLKVNVWGTEPHSQVQRQFSNNVLQQAWCSPKGWTSLYWQLLNYELFNHNNFNIHYWSWNYRGCWHQTCPPMDAHKKGVNFIHSNYKTWMPCIVISCHYLPVSGLGNLRACCLP